MKREVIIDYVYVTVESISPERFKAYGDGIKGMGNTEALAINDYKQQVVDQKMDDLLLDKEKLVEEHFGLVAVYSGGRA